FFARAGSNVTILDPNDRLLPRGDAEAGELLGKRFREEGIEIRLGTRADRIDPPCTLALKDGSTLRAERLLIAAGRIPTSQGIGLEHHGVKFGMRGAVVVDDRLQAAPNVWALGDVNGV